MKPRRPQLLFPLLLAPVVGWGCAAPGDRGLPPVDTAIPLEGARIEITGRVIRAGLRPLEEGTTLLEAVLDAGPLQGEAELRQVKLIRTAGGAAQVLTVDLEAMLAEGDTSANVLLAPGDLVVVPARIEATEETR